MYNIFCSFPIQECSRIGMGAGEQLQYRLVNLRDMKRTRDDAVEAKR
ncbi:hypothetical protein E2C01_078457 [Portunus trituberculatus]|uniref:Uncharacterized protein n=1 Tax=Portunus trituberculatus TaxID=210409 RepID=A0A5B7IEC5_PORTR|nr:hypothetical protein [Portunus trituberculatus]